MMSCDRAGDLLSASPAPSLNCCTTAAAWQNRLRTTVTSLESLTPPTSLPQGRETGFGRKGSQLFCGFRLRLSLKHVLQGESSFYCIFFGVMMSPLCGFYTGRSGVNRNPNDLLKIFCFSWCNLAVIFVIVGCNMFKTKPCYSTSCSQTAPLAPPLTSQRRNNFTDH